MEKGIEKDIELPSMSAIEKRWDHLITTMIISDLFVHEFLMMMSKYPNVAVKTMGVNTEGARIILTYNPFFLMSLTDEEARWVLYHEVLHVALHHCTTRQPNDENQKMLYNYAMDLAINQLIPTNHLFKAPTKLKPLMPSEFKFPEKLSMEQYLQLLWKWNEGQKNASKEKNENQNAGEGESSGGDEGEDNDESDTPNGTKTPKGGQVIDNHEGFKESDIVDQIIRTKIEEMQRQEKYWGNISGEAKALIDAAQKAKVDWRKQLRHQLGNHIILEKEPTIKRPNRRFGYPFMGTTFITVSKTLISLDTSGSVSDKCLGQFTAECNKAKDYMPIDVIQFDYSIQTKPVPITKKIKRLEAQGRGGTNFQPIIDFADEHRYKALVVLTDGGAPIPTKPKYVKDILWCIIGDYDFKIPWGRVIRIKDTLI